MSSDKIIYWIGFTVCVLGGVCVVAIFAYYAAALWLAVWEKGVEATRVTVWTRRFTRHWREFSEWHKQNKEPK